MVYFKYEYAPFDGLKMLRAVEFEPSTAFFSIRSLRFPDEGFKTRLLISERAPLLRGGGVNFISSVSPRQVKSGLCAYRSPNSEILRWRRCDLSDRQELKNGICTGFTCTTTHNNGRMMNKHASS